MDTFEIAPYVGMGPLKLGSEKQDIIDILGEPDTYLDRDSVTQLHYSGFCVHLNLDGKVEFIAASLDEDYSVTFLGLDLLRAEASKIIELVSTQYKHDENDFELGYSYVYPDIQVSFYRPTVPENENDNDGKYFQVACVAEPGYWDRIA